VGLQLSDVPAALAFKGIPTGFGVGRAARVGM
jgi:hypothetical protein